MKDVNVIGYLIEVLELMVKRKFDTFETAFSEYVVIRSLYNSKPNFTVMGLSIEK